AHAPQGFTGQRIASDLGRRLGFLADAKGTCRRRAVPAGDAEFVGPLAPRKSNDHPVITDWIVSVLGHVYPQGSLGMESRAAGAGRAGRRIPAIDYVPRDQSFTVPCRLRSRVCS